MIKGQVEIEVEAKPEIVFDLLANPTKAQTWNQNLTEASLFIEEPIKKGSKGRFIGRFGKRKMEYEIVYYEYNRPKFFSYEATNRSEISKMRYEFIPTEIGTKIDFQFEYQPKGLVRLLEPFIKLFKRLIIKQEQKELELLKDYITNSK